MSQSSIISNGLLGHDSVVQKNTLGMKWNKNRTEQLSIYVYI